MTSPSEDPRSTPPRATPGRRLPPFPFRELARVLMIPVVAVALFVVFFMNPEDQGRDGEKDGLRRISLLQKDANFEPVSEEDGGATGSVWYTPSGPSFSFELRAEGLDPSHKYLLEIAVDDVIYTVASLASSAGGELAIDTTLTRFAEGVCVGPNYDPPRPLDGRHEIRFWVKADGNPPSGTSEQLTPGYAEGADLPCSGNGDGDYTYVLLENETATYAGPGSEGSNGAATGASRPSPAAARVARRAPSSATRGSSQERPHRRVRGTSRGVRASVSRGLVARSPVTLGPGGRAFRPE